MDIWLGERYKIITIYFVRAFRCKLRGSMAELIEVGALCFLASLVAAFVLLAVIVAGKSGRE